MKLIITTSLLISGSVFAAETREVVNTTASVNLYSLRCETRVGSGIPEDRRQTTILGDREDSPGVFAVEGGTDLPHTGARALGCDLDKLNQISDLSKMSFGHIHDAPVEIVRETMRSRTNGAGMCVADFKETLNVQIGLGIVLSSVEYATRPVNDCP